MSTIDQYPTAVEARTETIETAYEQESYDDNYTVTVVSSRMYQAIEASSWDVPDLTKALRAVLALHRVTTITIPSSDGTEWDFDHCTECDADTYPCPTVTAITAALGCEAGKDAEVKVTEHDLRCESRAWHDPSDTPCTWRQRACVDNWPGCESGGYDPHCCRFPKSCSVRDVEIPESAS